MGYVKEYLLENDGINRFAYEDVYVCQECFDDPGLRQFISENASSDNCNYCDRASNKAIAVSLADLGRYMEGCLAREYADALNNLPWDGREGGFQWDHWDTYELLSDQVELSLPNDGGKLFHALCAVLGDQTWCKRDPFALNELEMLDFSWEMFRDIVKHKRRFLFWRETTDTEGELLDPGKMLRSLGEFCRSAGLSVVLPAGSKLFRARSEMDEQFSSVNDLGPPLETVATTSNRMSPAGIVMFYTSEDPDTALQEAARDPGRFVVGEFRTLRDVSILDLTALPEVPSVFESDRANFRHGLIFLRRFVSEFSKPITSDGSEHVEYVPTQIVTEYFRSTFKVANVSISGIRYPSAQRPGGSSLVLFADQSNFVNGVTEYGDKWLELVGVTKRVTVTVDNIDERRRPRL